MKKFLLICVVLILSISATAQTKVVVYVKGEIKEENLKKVFASKLVTAIAKSSDYVAIELNDNFIAAIDDEHNRQNSGEVNTKDAFEIGQRYAAKYIAAVDISEIFDEYFVSSHLIEAETSKVINAFDASSKIQNMTELSNLAEKIADGLIMGPYREAQLKESERKAKEERKRLERQEYEQYRNLAIKNLTPSGCILVGNYYVYDCEVRFSIDYSNKVILSIPQPKPGFRLADATELRRIGKYNLRNTFYIYNDCNPNPVNWRDKFSTKTKCTWVKHVFSMIREDFSEINIITLFNKKTDRLFIDYADRAHAAYIKDVPTEAQIQAEINRIKASY